MSNKIGLAILLGIIGLLVGGIFMYAVFPREVTITKEVPVEKVVTQEVVKEVIRDYKQEVVDNLLSQVSKDKDFRECQNIFYDTDEIVLKKVYNGFVYTALPNGDEKITDVKIALDFDGGKCVKTFTCSLDVDNKLSC